MKKSTIPYNVKQTNKMYEKGSLNFNHPIQRKAGQWGDYEKSLLVHSMLANYIIPAIYLYKEFTGKYDEKGKPIYKYYVLDGKQRLTTIYDFVNGKFALHEDIPGYEKDDEEYEIAGKYFSELEPETQEDILRFVFTIYNLEDCTDDEIEECFFRLNNGVALTKSQKSKVKIGIKVAEFIDEILERKFYTDICHFTAAQLRRSADQCTLMQSMLLLDMKHDAYELKSISENDIMDYATSLHNNYPEESKKRLVTIMDYLEKGFEKKEKFMKKINIPMFIYMADEAMDRDIAAEEFYKWFKEFADNYKPNDEYSQYCSTGSIKKEKVLGRLEVLKKSFNDYFGNNNEPLPFN